MEERLIKKFGVIEDKFKPLDFKWTSYYADELGEKYMRGFISFEKLIKGRNARH